MLKRISKSAVIITVMLSSTACSFSSVDSQQDTVEQFFSCFNQGSTDKIQELCTSDMQNELSLDSFEDSMELYMDEDSFGKTFTVEAEEFKEYVLENLFVSYKITDIETTKDKSKVKVKGRYKDFNTMDFNSSDIEKLANDYASENKEELSDIYLSNGYDGMMKKIYTDIAPDMFDALKHQLDGTESKKLDVTFTLDKKDSKWLISNITKN